MAAGIAAATAFAIVSGTAVAIGPVTWQHPPEPATTPFIAPASAASTSPSPTAAPAATYGDFASAPTPMTGPSYFILVQTSAEPTPSPMPDTVPNARTYTRAQIGTRQFACLDALWVAESQWNPRATNKTTGAYGIPQSLPASKMALAGSNWRTSPLTQVRWGLQYIAKRYGTACQAWTFRSYNGWY